MAKNLGENEEERKYRITMVGQYFMLTGKSTRKIAEEVTEWFFPISNATVHAYINEYKLLSPDDVTLINKQIAANAEKTVDDPKVRKRVLTVANMLLEGLLMNEIADKLKIPYWIVRNDLIHRLPKIDPVMFEEVKGRLNENSSVNLMNHEK